MPPMLLTALVIVFVLVMLVRSARHADFVVWTGIAMLLVLPARHPDGSIVRGVLDIPRAFAGLANEGVVTIAALFVVAAGVRDTGAMQMLVNRLLGAPRSERGACHAVVWPTALMSCFFNNTPLVALLLPVTDDWARRYRMAANRLLMPLSYASILGGACTLIGTSTNLIINGWLVAGGYHAGLGIFEVTPVMLPIALVGLLFVVYASPALLPLRRPVFENLNDAREYVVEMQVDANSELIGRTIDDAGLRGLPGLFLVEIDRGGEVLPAVSGNVRLAQGDHLVFAGVVDSVVDLQRFSGLRPATDQVFKLADSPSKRRLVEAVVSNTCPLVGRTIREGQFRTIYNAAVIAVARNGERVRGKIGDIELAAGDVLLLEARPSFLEQQRNRRDFYLVSQVDGREPVDERRAPLALAIVAGLVGCVALGLFGMLQAGLLAAFGMVATGCCNASAARRAIDWEVLLVIAGALGLGQAMEVSGLAAYLGALVIDACGSSPLALLVAIFTLSALLAGVVTAKAGAVLMLPVAQAASAQLGIALMPLVIAVMLAASMAVATPIGYPTNLMIYGPGGYRFSDYLRLGGPLTLLIGVLGAALIPLFWPFAT
ncbi:MAG: anion permease [Gammaproteobacteria bacterium]|nr:anion permease [Gammaproteobacteria bacterium]